METEEQRYRRFAGNVELLLFLFWTAVLIGGIVYLAV